MANEGSPGTLHVHGDEEDEEEASARTCDRAINRCDHHALDPRTKWVQEWNRIFLLVCGTGLIVDPLFFYSLSIADSWMCLYIDGWFALTVTAVRCMTDLLHVWNIWLHLKTGYGTKRPHVEGHKAHYLRSIKGFFLDLFVILPVPQVMLWGVAPTLIARGSTTTVMTVSLIMFLFQYLPKIYHSVRLLRRMQNLSGYIFGTVWWGIALNMIAYFVASHAAGACWYLLGIQRAAKCLKEECQASTACYSRALGCQQPIYYGTTVAIDRGRLAWGNNKSARSMCIDSSDNFTYGAYKWTVPLVTNTSRLEKILFPIFWGLMTLSTFGNLESTTEWLEVVFNIIILTSGLILVTMLIGNIKVFLHATTSKKQAMHLKMRNMEWWMRRKHLPQNFRHRVRQYERQRWAAMRGVDECEMIRNLPEGLRRDIKYHLCLDLVRQVPLFQHMDELVLENICDRVKSLVFPKGETVISIFF
eukprot:TRINITY_DN5285_c0_g1_i1.p1 TRINITY_DN5285_c0_g1~~TRINITY_DN5285_c0_g1_i1.p1  ORF type:complete len:473 (+),score=22.79 TRINITY_DN5285_c0_g1_i1:39-1457(+)